MSSEYSAVKAQSFFLLAGRIGIEIIGVSPVESFFEIIFLLA
jgi:hypothetical protein